MGREVVSGHTYPGSKENCLLMHALSNSINSGIGLRKQRSKVQVSVSGPRGRPGGGNLGLREASRLRASSNARSKQSHASLPWPARQAAAFSPGSRKKGIVAELREIRDLFDEALFRTLRTPTATALFKAAMGWLVSLATCFDLSARAPASCLPLCFCGLFRTTSGERETGRGTTTALVGSILLLFVFPADVAEQVGVDVQTDVGHIIKMLACDQPDEFANLPLGIIAA